MSRVIPLFGPHVCDSEFCAFPCPLKPENIKTRKERREARRYAAKQVRRAQRRSKP